MRRAIGIGCILLGIACLLASVGYVASLRYEDQKAGESSRVALQAVQSAIQAPTFQLPEAAPEEAPEPTIATTEVLAPSLPVAEPVEAEPEMPTVNVDGYDYIGILSIPVLELELPVFAGWSYEKLSIAPCHYYGSYLTGAFVIAGHNYSSHFGGLSSLQPQDLILFTDAQGAVHHYEVYLLETLAANATKEMICSGFDLSLYTCTPGGGSRVTVRCLLKDDTVAN